MKDKSVSVHNPDATSLERWLGRNEAFAMIAGRCSAAYAAGLREIRDNKKYVDAAANWDEFCRVVLKSSRKRIDNVIRQLDEHGPEFFHATQAHRLTEPEYVALKEHFSAEGMKINGEILCWGEGNNERIAQEIGKLRAIAAPKPAKKAPTFESVLERLEALNLELQKWQGTLDDRQRRSLGEGLLRLSNLAERWSVKLITR